jgi:hypothetical protein
VVDSVSSVHSRRAYGSALNEFFGWYRASVRSPFSKAVVQEYRSHLEAQGRAPSTINVLLAAIRKLAAEAADNGLLAPELAAGIGKVKGAWDDRACVRSRSIMRVHSGPRRSLLAGHSTGTTSRRETNL